MHSFTFNGHSSDEFGIRIERFPDLNRSARKFKSASVPGRNGNIYQLEDAWEEVTVSYNIYAGSRTEGSAVSAFTDIMEWLHSADDYAELSDTYDEDHYRLAVFVDDTEIESEWHSFGKATIKFRCRPQRYLNYSIQNLLPKMTAGTYTNTGITVVVDEEGVPTLSGRTTSWASVDIPLDYQLTITQAMVDAGLTLYINGEPEGLSNVRLLGQGGSTVSFAFNTVTRLSESYVGRTITGYQLHGQGAGYTVSGSFSIEMKTDRPMVGDAVYNPTNHVAHPIITLTGGDIYPNMLNLETPYNITSDSDAVANWNPEWLNNIAFVEPYSGSVIGHRVRTYTQATASSYGGTLSAHVNSTGTLTFTNINRGGTYIGIGRGVTLTPDSDYTLTCTASAGLAGINVSFFESEGAKPYNSFASTHKTQDYAVDLSLTFHVPPTCSNTLIVFYTNASETITFSNILLVASDTAQVFNPYTEEGFTETFTLGDTTLTFTTKGFSTAVIDCERENFTVDGVNYNNQSTITDQYGNIAVDYMRLVPGYNAVTFTEEIESVSMDPRVWEL